MVKHHYVVVKNSDGSVQLQPLKPWLRANTKYIPPGSEALVADQRRLRVLFPVPMNIGGDEL
jgi:hypothetical protein